MHECTRDGRSQILLGQVSHLPMTSTSWWWRIWPTGLTKIIQIRSKPNHRASIIIPNSIRERHQLIRERMLERAAHRWPQPWCLFTKLCSATRMLTRISGHQLDSHKGNYSQLSMSLKMRKAHRMIYKQILQPITVLSTLSIQGLVLSRWARRISVQK